MCACVVKQPQDHDVSISLSPFAYAVRVRIYAPLFFCWRLLKNA